MPRKALVYLYGVALVATPVLYVLGWSLDPSQWPILLSLTLAFVAFDLLRIESPTGQSLTLNSAVNLAAILLGGPALAVWAAGVGQFVSSMIMGQDRLRTIFNTTQGVLTVSVAGVVYQWLGGGAHLTAQDLGAALGASITYFLVNSILIAILFGLMKRQRVLTMWYGMAKQGVESYMTVQILGLIAAFLLFTGGMAWAGVLALLLLLLQRLLGSYYRVLRQRDESGKQQAVQDSLIRALVAALDARDVYTSGHSGRVARYADLLAREMGLGDSDREALKYASLLHDVGKLGIPDSVLRKDGPLTPTERALMMEHPLRGIDILGQMPNVPEMVRQAVRHHHEWYSGGGYPDGIKGNEIPLGARIIAVADALDAMTSARPYRAGIPWDEAINRLKQGRAIQFDPDVVSALLRLVEQSPDLFRQVSSEPRLRLSDLERKLELEQECSGRILPVHSREVKILYHLAMDRGSLLDLSQTLHRVLEVLYDTIGSHSYFIMLIDDQTGELVVRSVAGCHAGLLGKRWSLQAEPWRYVVEQKHSFVMFDNQKASAVQSLAQDTRSSIAVPLMAENQVIGMLGVESRFVGTFGQDEVYLLTAVARQLADAIEVARAHERMTYAATHDGLTGALNRSTFYHHLESELQKAEAEHYQVTVAVLDIDNFKQINDTHGHLMGDQIMQAFGQRLASGLRRTDQVARYGGDEFAIIMPHTDREAAVLRLSEMVSGAQQRPEGDETEMPAPTASWGVATFPFDGCTAEELVGIADNVMYRQKRSKVVQGLAG